MSVPAYKWVSLAKGQKVPENAVAGGRDVDGCTLYVGRMPYKGDLLPGKVIADKNEGYVCYDGVEYQKKEYEVLCKTEFAWESAKNGSVPADAVPGGKTSTGETLYVGRADHQGSKTIGKVHPSHGCLYMPFFGKELPFKEYEVLVFH